jgi:hypothetical protein
MRDFGTVATRFWTGGTGKRLRGDLECQILAVYLMSSPHSSMTGLYHLPMSYISEDTGIPFEGASKALLRLSKEGFCIYDEETDVIFVVNMAKHQIGDSLSEGDKRRKWLKKELQKLPATALLLNFYEKYGKAYLLDQEHGLPNNMKPLRSPLPAPWKPLRSQDMDMDREQDRNREQEREARVCDRIEEAVYEPHPNMSHDTLLVLNRIREHWPEYDVVQASECAVKLKSYYWDKLDLLAMIDEAWAGWEPGRSIHDKRGVHGYLSAWASNAVEKALRAAQAPKNGNGTKGTYQKETAAAAQQRRQGEILRDWLDQKEAENE